MAKVLPEPPRILLHAWRRKNSRLPFKMQGEMQLKLSPFILELRQIPGISMLSDRYWGLFPATSAHRNTQALLKFPRHPQCYLYPKTLAFMDCITLWTKGALRKFSNLIISKEFLCYRIIIKIPAVCVLACAVSARGGSLQFGMQP